MKPSNALPNQNASLKSDDSRPGCSQNVQPGGENTLNDSTSLNKSTLLKRNATKQKRLVRQSRIGVQKSQAESVSRCKSCGEIWIIASRILTFWARPTFMEKVVKITDPSVQQAWREKVALCTISFLMCFFLGFFTFLFQSSSCPPPQGYYTDIQELERLSKILSNDNHKVLINGRTYRLDNWWSNHPDVGGNDFLTRISGKDISSLFVFDNPSCRELGYQTPQFCSISSLYPEFDDIPNHCHKLSETTKRALNKMKVENINFDWPDVDGHPTRSCFNNYVLDFNAYLKMNVPWLGEEADSIIKSILGKDSTDVFAKNNKIPLAKCLIEVYGVGTMLTQSLMCSIANLILNLALVIISGLVFAKFLLAFFFYWLLSRQLGQIVEVKKTLKEKAREKYQSIYKRSDELIFAPENIKSDKKLTELSSDLSNATTAAVDPQYFTLFNWFDTRKVYKEIYTICLVTCYSEGETGLRTTLDSIAQTDYDDKYKLIFVVADGKVFGSGNPKPTSSIMLDMIDLDPAYHGSKEYVFEAGKDGKKEYVVDCKNAEPQAYKAIGMGSKSINMAKIYCGTYQSKGNRVAMILVNKCGTEAEANTAKPGNRGKRDSQILLMDFLSAVTFNDDFSPLHFDLFNKMTHIMTLQNGGKQKITPDLFEIVLMLDADTCIMPDALSRMVSVMQRDPTVMGLCGETKILNKNESWVTMIQVFEYYISHHLAKAFESVFGGVTCLPGCFCMYRIKSPKPQSGVLSESDVPWVPIISDPEIVRQYAESVVDTLHKKNLLLLGEDRYLTTLMLRKFPTRKMMFVPKATCRTQVPVEFKVLLSQRRRWINSTIHNLMELIFVQDLCGTFCCSMQFVILLELIGTVTLPAAIIFTSVVIIVAIIGPIVPIVPLLLLAAILGLPAVLIVLTTRELKYVFYMIVYLLALPIWNFVLPVYSFWHFDDFSWGITRQVAGEKQDKGGHGGHDSEESIDLEKKPWSRWEKERLEKLMVDNEDDIIGKARTRERALSISFGNSTKTLKKSKLSTMSLSFEKKMVSFVAPGSPARSSARISPNAISRKVSHLDEEKKNY